MSVIYRVSLIGFSAAEHAALAAALQLPRRQPGYEVVADPLACEFVVADADHAESLAEVVRIGLTDHAVYIGSGVPEDAPGWLGRPVATSALLCELDELVTQYHGRSKPAAAAGAQATTPQPRPAIAAKRLLVVDDSEIALRYLESRLQVHGLTAERALTSGKAIEMVARKPYDIVFLDVELGSGSDIDGLALCQHIKRHHHHAGAEAPAVVLVSAHHAEIDRARGTLAGCDAYLGKPLDDEALLRVLVQQGAVPAPVKARRRR